MPGSRTEPVALMPSRKFRCGMQRARAHLFLEAHGPWNVQRMVFWEKRGPFQLPIIEHVNNIAMAAGHLDASNSIR